MGTRDETGVLKGASNSSISNVENWLILVAPFVLSLAGLGLVIASFAFRDSPDVASPGIVIGSSLLVVGAILPRIEGDFKFGSRGVEAAIRGLPRTVENDMGIKMTKRDDVIENASVEFLRDIADEQLPAAQLEIRVLDSYERARDEYFDFENRVSSWLVENGWSVRNGNRDDPFDFIAIRGTSLMLIEAKMSSKPLRRNAISQSVERLRRANVDPEGKQVTIALFVATPVLLRESVREALASGVQIYHEVAGEFEKVALEK
jgi:hypothetical protein